MNFLKKFSQISKKKNDVKPGAFRDVNSIKLVLTVENLTSASPRLLDVHHHGAVDVNGVRR